MLYFNILMGYMEQEFHKTGHFYDFSSVTETPGYCHDLRNVPV